MSYADKARRADGSIRPYAEIAEAELRAKTAARYAEIHAEREREAAKSETQKRLETFQREYEHARHNDDHGRAKFYKSHVDSLKEQLASEQAQVAKVKAFANDRRIQLIRQEADLIERSGHTLLRHASQVERDVLIQIARSEDYPDPESQYRDFKELSDKLTDVELEAERVKASDATIEANRQNLTVAESTIRTTELQQAKARREAVAHE